MGSWTHGRVWHTDEEGNIAFSFIINTNCDVKKLDNITIKIAQIIVEIFEKLYKIKLQIKEPNDIVFNGKKIGGILTESKISGNTAKYIVVGIGINTNKQNFTQDIENIASSIKKEFNIDVDRDKVIAKFCNMFEKEIDKRKE